MAKESNKLRSVLKGRDESTSESKPKQQAPKLTVAKKQTKADQEPLEQMTVRLPTSLAEELREAGKLLGPKGFTIQSIFQNAVSKELRALSKDIQQMREFLGQGESSVQ